MTVRARMLRSHPPDAAGALIVAGIAIGGTGGTILAIVGVVPLAAGAFNVFLFAPLFGLDFTGHKRAAS
jgi:hypothetical protein